MEKIRKNLKLIIYTIRLICSINKWRFIFAIFMSIINGIIPIISLLLMQKILNEVQLMQKPFNVILKMLFLYFLISAFTSMLQNISNYNMNNLNNQLVYGINAILMNKCGALSLRMFETTDIYDTITRLEQEVSVKPYQTLQAILSICANSVSLVSASLILIPWNPIIVAILLIISLLMFGAEIYIGNKEFIMHYNRSDKERRAWYYSYLLTHDIAVKEIKVYGLKDYFMRKYRQLSGIFVKQISKIEKIKVLLNTGLAWIQDIIGLVIMVLVIHSAFLKKIMIGTMMSYLNAVSIIQSTTNSMAANVYTIYNANLYINLLKDFLENQKYDEENSGIESIDLIESVELRQVEFDYPQFKGALNNISLRISRGEQLAIVGKNGSGKSTLLKILSGLYKCTTGEILVNERNIGDVDIEEYRKHVSVLFQDFLKYEGTLGENIMLGDIEVKKNEERIFDALQKSNVDFLEDINGYQLEKELGAWFDNGVQLSGGQWQKIALARAYYKNADIYLLDEPSAALDVMAESKIFENFFNLCREKIGIYITHRVKIAQNASKIVVMEKGSIVGIGTHKELLSKCKVYQELYAEESNFFDESKL